MAADADREPTSGGDSGGKPDGYGRLARRVLFWSSHLLATGVIVVLGLAFGGQVLQWWHQQPPSITAPHDQAATDFMPMAHPDVSQLLEFGDLPITLGRVVFEGDQEKALAELRRRCREIALRSVSMPQAPERVETSLARRLAKSEPVEQGQGWKIFQNAGPILMVIAIRSIPATPGDDAPSSARPGAASVLSWGLGLRHFGSATSEEAAPNRWTLFTCSPKGQPADSPRELPLPLPPGSRRTLSVRVERGGTLIGFAGRARGAAWRQYFDDAFDLRGWARSGNWLRMGTNWHARYEHGELGACDVQLADEANELLRGILTVAPAAVGPEK